MHLQRGQKTSTTFHPIDTAHDAGRFDENPQFFRVEEDEAKPHARPQAVVIPDERAVIGDFDFRPRWWPGAYLREV